ncbi:MAG: glycosyltransferase family 2 protein [Chitinophagaceae bacterium]
MHSLSVVIITFNEEKKIARCLDSVADVADEIIVVDSLSTDSTKAICKSYTKVVFIEQPFLGYVNQKEFALRKASYENVLCLDADEFLSDELKRSIATEKQKGFLKDGYTMNRLNNYCGQWIKHGDYYPDRKLRLCKKEKVNWRGDDPHDVLVLHPNTSSTHLKGDLCHFSFYTFEEHVTKMNKFSTLAAVSMFNRGKKKNYFKLIVNPAWAFFNGYILKAGFMDGLAGYTIAKVNAFYTFMKYLKLIRLYQQKENE